MADGLGIAEGLRWLVLDLNSFFASCEQQENPDLRGRPLAVVPTMAMTTCAIAASYEAKKLVIKTGTLIHEALKLCPDLVLVEARHKRYVEFHHRILKSIEACIPIHKVMSIDEVSCRLDRIQQQPDAARALAQALKDCIHDEVGECLTSSVGIASNPFLAKLASNMQKPNGLTLLHPGDMPGAILHLPLRSLPGVGANMLARLNRAGIENMAALYAASPERMRRIWGGINGVKFHALLHGIDVTGPATSRRSIGHQHVLAPAMRNKREATLIIRRLLVKGGQRLRSEGLFCRRVTLHVKWDRHQGYWEKDRDVLETQDTGLLLETLGRLWAELPEWRPLRVGITLSALVPAGAHQPDLFDHRQAEGVLSHALDRLNDKFGADTIGYGLCAPRLQSKIAFNRVPELSEF